MRINLESVILSELTHHGIPGMKWGVRKKDYKLLKTRLLDIPNNKINLGKKNQELYCRILVLSE